MQGLELARQLATTNGKLRLAFDALESEHEESRRAHTSLMAENSALRERLSLSELTLAMESYPTAPPDSLLAQIQARCYLAFTRYCSTSKLYCGSPSSFYCPPHPPHAKPTLMQYYCTPISQHTLSPRPPLCMPYTIQYWVNPNSPLMADKSALPERLLLSELTLAMELYPTAPPDSLLAQIQARCCLAFTRYCPTSKLYCRSPSSFYCPPPHMQSLP